MSDLKYMSLNQLYAAKSQSEKMLRIYGSKMAGERERLAWIGRYIEQRRPQKLPENKPAYGMWHCNKMISQEQLISLSNGELTPEQLGMEWIEQEPPITADG